MQQTWALQDAKNRFSTVVNRTLSEGPQIVTRHGIPVVAIIPISDLDGQSIAKESFVQFFRNSPLFDCNLDLNRDKSTCREVSL